MDLKIIKQKRIDYLREVYKHAYTGSPKSPASATFGLSKTRPYNMVTKEFSNNDAERGGYIIGEQLGLSREEVDSIVIYFSDNEVGYMSSTLGLKQFNITQRGIMYLESLEEEAPASIQIQNNHITIRDINSPAQFQQGSNHSTQTQENKYSAENVNQLFNLLKADIQQLNTELKEEMTDEMEYAVKQLNKGKNISTQLFNIGGLIKDVGVNVFAGLIASPIFEIMKPALGL